MRSDAALVERFAAGDEAAFAVLYQRYRTTVLAVCIGVLGSRHDAEDAAQEAFAALAVALQATPPRELRPWLARVARNAAIDTARRRRSTTPATYELAEPASSPSGVRAELESVIDGLRELPESQRSALLMRELGGYSYREIATVLELDEQGVRGLIARARIGLRGYREATELPCATAREALAAEPDGRRRSKSVRRHVRNCDACNRYRQALRADARALRGLIPIQAGGAAGGTAVAGGLAAKSVLVGTSVTQVTAACAVSVCAVGSVVALYPHTWGDRALRPSHHLARTAIASHATSGLGSRAKTASLPSSPIVAGTARRTPGLDRVGPASSTNDATARPAPDKRQQPSPVSAWSGPSSPQAQQGQQTWQPPQAQQAQQAWQAWQRQQAQQAWQAWQRQQAQQAWQAWQRQRAQQAWQHQQAQQAWQHQQAQQAWQHQQAQQAWQHQQAQQAWQAWQRQRAQQAWQHQQAQQAWQHQQALERQQALQRQRARRRHRSWPSINGR